MKTNLLNLMSKVSILERDCSDLMYDLKANCMNISIIELNGREEELENNSDFDDRLRKFMDMQEEVTKLKGIICDKNNELKLSNGKSIAQTLIELKNKRKSYHAKGKSRKRKFYHFPDNPLSCSKNKQPRHNANDGSKKQCTMKDFIRISVLFSLYAKFNKHINCFRETISKHSSNQNINLICNAEICDTFFSNHI